MLPRLTFDVGIFGVGGILCLISIAVLHTVLQGPKTVAQSFA